jgi:hypothetical protein
MVDAAALIERYQLQPHPEGGWDRELHRSDRTVQCADGAQRSALTLILWGSVRTNRRSPPRR